MVEPRTQTDKFKEAAREAGCDENEARWTTRLKRIVAPQKTAAASKPKPKK